MLQIDAGRSGGDSGLAAWLNQGDGEDARNLLSTLLTALITMASMTFSITVVALTVAASQYGSRLIRIFRSDLRTQATIGVFAATIVYTLLVLRVVEGKAPVAEVPHVAATLGTGLSLLCVLALLAFIQGIARNIVADQVVERVGRDLEEAVEVLPPLQGSDPQPRPPSDVMAALDGDAAPVALSLEGYVQAVDYDGLVALGGRTWGDRRSGFPRRPLPGHRRSAGSDSSGPGRGARNCGGDRCPRCGRPGADADPGSGILGASPGRGGTSGPFAEHQRPFYGSGRHRPVARGPVEADGAPAAAASLPGRLR